ncbi:tetratricopeptide repeat protein [Microbulbifer variabilis]|uniref:tetratricopeptide repeat protein n=1 Tax=Microbulbifer variabilis TaxID=266805 RepID=UPI001CFE83D8|nr:tetratricopeptide repeat protein [Microbulbifer variabilis]
MRAELYAQIDLRKANVVSEIYTMRSSQYTKIFIRFLALLTFVVLAGCVVNPDIENAKNRSERVISQIEVSLHFEEYNSHPDMKALAIAVSDKGAASIGWAYDCRTQEEANILALKECESRRDNRKVKQRCYIYSEGHASLSDRKITDIYLGELHEEASELAESGEYERGVSVAMESLKIAADRIGPDTPQVARALKNLAYFNLMNGNLESAELNIKRALEILEKSRGTNHPSFISTLDNLADFYRVTERPERAELISRRAEEIRLQVKYSSEKSI